MMNIHAHTYSLYYFLSVYGGSTNHYKQVIIQFNTLQIRTFKLKSSYLVY